MAWVTYVGPLAANPRKLKLDISDTELVENHQRVTLRVRWPDLPDVASIEGYTLEEVGAEKLRCIAERVQCRDLYDLHTLLDGNHIEPLEAWELYLRKAETTTAPKASSARPHESGPARLLGDSTPTSDSGNESCKTTSQEICPPSATSNDKSSVGSGRCSSQLRLSRINQSPRSGWSIPKVERGRILRWKPNSNEQSGPRLRRVDDAQHLNSLVHNAVGIAAHDAFTRTGYYSWPTQQRELGQAVGGVKDHADHPIWRARITLGIVGIRGTWIVLRGRHEDNPHTPVRSASVPSAKSAGSMPLALNRATTSSIGIPSPA
jgi:hypothetical protein